ncbi:KRAB-A domain-containing protein 2-like [Lepeophtheirus salmonis]|nr:KRAB-A domain-containing protein 2-like isoform X1 [Lepeophtheirus salmonis]XP_040583638.1 KRAB-A domain-containing protein 2-like isoform X1 [Lepeophtheirus salmonis]
MESKPDGEYKWILHYQDQRTKFSNLCALKSIEVTEVASSLLDIFLNFGPPHILESENGREFAGKVIIELKTMWPDVVIVHGGSCNPQGESSAEDVNDDVKEILMAWLLDNKTSKWSEGLKFIQFNKNRSYHCGINQSPYSAMFGYEPEVGISTSNIPKEILHGLQTEEDLTAINEIDIYTQTPELVYKSEDIPDMSGKIL